MFSGKNPNAQKKTRARWTACGNDFTTFIKKNLPASAPAAAITCWGSEPDEAAAAQNVVGNALRTNQDVERLGEAGAIYKLQEHLAHNGVTYDDDNLYIFDGANAFNMVYFDPAPPNATTAIILEAKGGDSTLGERWDIVQQNRVKQGTAAYADTIIKVMKNSSDSDRRLVGLELAKLQGGKKVGYVGVQTKYDKKAGLVSEPVIIFAEAL